MVAGCIAVAFVADHLALALLLAETPPLLGQGLHALATIVFYPLIAVFSQLIGVQPTRPGRARQPGHPRLTPHPDPPPPLTRGPT